MENTTNYFSNPARLLDCPYCDGTYFPEDDNCSFCGNSVRMQKDYEEFEVNQND